MILTFDGPTALSDFRSTPLLARCRERVPQIASFESRFIYAVHLESAPDRDQMQRLERILDARGSADLDTGTQVLVCPRPGTISPWSSKATDILHNCGMEIVARVERGIAYTFTCDGLAPRDIQPVLPLLYDRMTEAVVDDVELLFQTVEPQPLIYIPLQDQGRQALE